MGGSTLKIELGGDLILFHADPTNFLPLWSRMVGATADMRRLADEAIAKIYNLSELRHTEALLPKNHVQAKFDINLRLTTLNFYENRKHQVCCPVSE